MKRNLLILFLSIFTLLLVACSGDDQAASGTNGTDSNGGAASDDEVIKLSYAFFAPAGTFPAVQMEEWKERLEERTDGKVEVELFPGGTLLTAENMYDGVASGTADIGLNSTSYEPGRFPLLEISDMPSNYSDAVVASKVVSDLIEKYPPEAFEDYKIITSFATEPMYIQSKEPITSLDEMKGKQLRIGGAVAPVLEEMGAAPVGMSQAEVPEALQTGIVDGYVSSREILKDTSLAEMVDYVTDYPLVINTFVAVMTKEKWDSLPEDVQEVIEELKGEMTLFAAEYLDEHVQESMDWSQEEHGLEVVELESGEAEKWEELLSAYQEEKAKELDEEGLPGTEYLNDLRELVEKYNAE